MECKNPGCGYPQRLKPAEGQGSFQGFDVFQCPQCKEIATTVKKSGIKKDKEQDSLHRLANSLSRAGINPFGPTKPANKPVGVKKSRTLKYQKVNQPKKKTPPPNAYSRPQAKREALVEKAKETCPACDIPATEGSPAFGRSCPNCGKKPSEYNYDIEPDKTLSNKINKFIAKGIPNKELQGPRVPMSTEPRGINPNPDAAYDEMRESRPAKPTFKFRAKNIGDIEYDRQMGKSLEPDAIASKESGDFWNRLEAHPEDLKRRKPTKGQMKRAKTLQAIPGYTENMNDKLGKSAFVQPSKDLAKKAPPFSRWSMDDKVNKALPDKIDNFIAKQVDIQKVSKRTGAMIGAGLGGAALGPLGAAGGAYLGSKLGRDKPSRTSRGRKPRGMRKIYKPLSVKKAKCPNCYGEVGRSTKCDVCGSKTNKPMSHYGKEFSKPLTTKKGFGAAGMGMGVPNKKGAIEGAVQGMKLGPEGAAAGAVAGGFSKAGAPKGKVQQMKAGTKTTYTGSEVSKFARKYPLLFNRATVVNKAGADILPCKTCGKQVPHFKSSPPTTQGLCSECIRTSLSKPNPVKKAMWNTQKVCPDAKCGWNQAYDVKNPSSAVLHQAKNCPKCNKPIQTKPFSPNF